MSSEPIRVLQVIGAMDRGGAETLVMNLMRNIDRARVQFDFLVNETRKCDYDDEIESLGGRIWRIPRFELFNTPSYVRACKEFFRVHQYPIVHGHIGFPAAIYLSYARQNGAYTIAHSHAQNYPTSPEQLVFRAVSHPVRHKADYFIACSEQAGIDRFGREVVNGPNFHLLKNGIDINAIRFSSLSRSKVRNELGIGESTPVFGHVGRLTPVKNHAYLFEVFKEVKRQLPDAVLLLCGRGEIENELKERVRELGLSDSVRFLGVRDDVPAVLSSLDVFVFTSFSEGLSNAVVEAQASGLPCVISTGVPQLAAYTTQASFLDLSAGAERWAAACLDAYERRGDADRAKAFLNARDAGFDIAESAKWLQEFYLEKAARNAR